MQPVCSHMAHNRRTGHKLTLDIKIFLLRVGDICLFFLRWAQHIWKLIAVLCIINSLRNSQESKLEIAFTL